MRWSLREVVELFHLALLGELGARLGKDRYGIKGGCNLRFFFRSVRYSEDLDADVGKVGSGTLKKAMDHTLQGRSLKYTLAAAGIAIVRVSAPKQTEVTQRWKIGLSCEGIPAHTKLEFSRRGLGDGTLFEQVDPALTARYGLTPMLATHYDRATAIEQKLKALIGRTETQARDVFDLHLLLTGDHAELKASHAQREQAIERMQTLDFETFRSQVAAFLSPEQQAAYASEAVWRQVLQHVLDALRESP